MDWKGSGWSPLRAWAYIHLVWRANTVVLTQTHMFNHRGCCLVNEGPLRTYQSSKRSVQSHIENKVAALPKFIIHPFYRALVSLVLLKIHYNALEWERRFTFWLNDVKTTNYIEKSFKLKVSTIKFHTKKSVGAHIYFLQEWSYGAPKIGMSQILYWNRNVDSLSGWRLLKWPINYIKTLFKWKSFAIKFQTKKSKGTHANLPQEWSYGLEKLPPLKYYNVSDWKNRFTSRLNAARNTHYFKKCFT